MMTHMFEESEEAKHRRRSSLIDAAKKRAQKREATMKAIAEQTVAKKGAASQSRDNEKPEEDIKTGAESAVKPEPGEDPMAAKRAAFRKMMKERQERADKERKEKAMKAKEEIEKEKPTCSICLGSNGGVHELKCGHTFHYECIHEQLSKKWTSHRVTFNFMACALCRKDIALHQNISETEKEIVAMLSKYAKLREEVHKVCLETAKVDGSIEGLEKMPDEKQRKAVAAQMAAFLCSECTQPFCGGRVECGAGEESIDPKTLMCQKCSYRITTRGRKCPKNHGVQFAIFKCDCCCNIATYDCSGNHYCNPCHNNFDKKVGRPFCRGRPGDKCPLGIPHAPNQSRDHSIRRNGFVVGCTKCLGIDSYCQANYYVSNQTRARFAKEGTFFDEGSAEREKKNRQPVPQQIPAPKPNYALPVPVRPVPARPGRGPHAHQFRQVRFQQDQGPSHLNPAPRVRNPNRRRNRRHLRQ
ncbi:hypothetical protein AAMO2058_000587000 [Amorphochlora amoebiformis]